MPTPARPPEIRLPPLPDEVAADLLDFLQDFILVFESRYGHQIRRHYDSLATHNLITRHPPVPPDDPPF